jgi:hypothetical protein
MRKEWILTDEEKSLKREKIVRNRMIKQRTKIVIEHQINDHEVSLKQKQFFSLFYSF